MTDGPHPVRVVFIVVLVATAGCSYVEPGFSQDPVWSLSASGHTEHVNGTYEFVGNVSLGGQYNGVEVSGITVTFVGPNGDHLKTTRVGTFDGSNGTARIDESFDRAPEYVLVRIESVDDAHSDRRDPSIVGLERHDDGTYYPYTDYDPYASPRSTR